MWLVDDCKKIDTFNVSKGVALKEGSRAAWDTAISGYPIARTVMMIILILLQKTLKFCIIQKL